MEQSPLPSPADVQSIEREANLSPLRRFPEITYRATLSLIQKRFWLINRLIARQAAYNVFGRIRIRGPLNVEAYCRAWAALIERQESLRTTFKEHGATVVQEILPSLPCPVSV